jgi:hypothetical protein
MQQASSLEGSKMRYLLTITSHPEQLKALCGWLRQSEYQVFMPATSGKNSID